jgi:hypothetical protein
MDVKEGGFASAEITFPPWQKHLRGRSDPLRFSLHHPIGDVFQ